MNATPAPYIRKIPTHKATNVKKTQATVKAKVKKAEGRQSLLSKTLELSKKLEEEGRGVAERSPLFLTCSATKHAAGGLHALPG